MHLIDDGSDDDWERELAEEEADRRRKAEPPPQLSAAEFEAWRSPKTGESNPARLENPLWQWMVRTRWDAYNANKLFSGPSPFEAGPMWCFDRFGKSETALPDGRIVHIGGEHEDDYDPDFQIYNDVTVVDAAGRIAIYGYPLTDFPPTDFHSATLVGGDIYIIGRLGYPESRVTGATPVYKLSLASMRIEAIEAFGDLPGWIYGHHAALSSDGRRIVVTAGTLWLGSGAATRRNYQEWALDLRTRQWLCSSGRNWQQWVMRRIDRKPNRLWEIRQALWNREHPGLGSESHWAFGDEPDFDALAKLYKLADEANPVFRQEPLGAYATVIDGLTICFKEERFWVEAIVEGQLQPERLADLQRTTLALLERIDSAPYEIEETLRDTSIRS